jgi:hypothetical protein
MELTGGAHLAVTAGGSVVAGLHKLEEEMAFGKYAKAAQAGWSGWPLGRLGRKQGKMISELKIRFLNLPRLWKFVEGDLGGILT